MSPEGDLHRHGYWLSGVMLWVDAYRWWVARREHRKALYAYREQRRAERLETQRKRWAEEAAKHRAAMSDYYNGYASLQQAALNHGLYQQASLYQQSPSSLLQQHAADNANRSLGLHAQSLSNLLGLSR